MLMLNLFIEAISQYVAFEGRWGVPLNCRFTLVFTKLLNRDRTFLLISA